MTRGFDLMVSLRHARAMGAWRALRHVPHFVRDRKQCLRHGSGTKAP